MAIMHTDVADPINTITNSGNGGHGYGVVNFNGKPASTADIMAELALADLDANDLKEINDELEGVIKVWKSRNNPNQYIPSDMVGLTPTLDIRIPGNHNQRWSIGVRWDR